jgi:hypothetical protein
MGRGHISMHVASDAGARAGVLKSVFVKRTPFFVQVEQFEYLPGMEQLLQRLRAAGNEMHAITNYPVWYKWIEDKLRLSQYLQWTFMSCEGPLKVRTPQFTLVT